MEQYSINEIVKTFGISRTTILYYEKCGLITSHRNENNGYRIYTHEDVLTIKLCISLRNIGYSISDIIEIVKSGKAYDIAFIKKLILWNVRYQEAICRQLDITEKMNQVLPDVIFETDIPELYIIRSNCEDGYHHICQSEESNLLIRNLPVTTFMRMYEGFSFDVKRIEPKIYRVINKADFDLFFDPGIEDKFIKMPAMKCIARKYPNRENDIPMYNNEIKAYLDENNFKLIRDPFSIDPIHYIAGQIVYFPVEKRQP